MLASYGLCFGLMNDKARWLTDRLRALRIRVRRQGEDPSEETTLFDRMLRCPYCTGFHTGWMTWLGFIAAMGLPISVGGTTAEIVWGIVGNVARIVIFAFASSAFCYLADTGAQWLESSIR